MKLEEKGGVQKCLRSNSTADSIYNNVQKGKTTTKMSIEIVFYLLLETNFYAYKHISRLDLINWLQHKYFTAKTRQHGSDSIAFFLFQTTQGVKMAKHKSKQNKWEGKGERMGNSHS